MEIQINQILNKRRKLLHREEIVLIRIFLIVFHVKLPQQRRQHKLISTHLTFGCVCIFTKYGYVTQLLFEIEAIAVNQQWLSNNSNGGLLLGMH